VPTPPDPAVLYPDVAARGSLAAALQAKDIRRAAPFVHLTGRFEVPDHDPTRLTESEWQSMRQEAAELE
jgi:hypothetical protein